MISAPATSSANLVRMASGSPSTVFNRTSRSSASLASSAYLSLTMLPLESEMNTRSTGSPASSTWVVASPGDVVSDDSSPPHEAKTRPATTMTITARLVILSSSEPSLRLCPERCPVVYGAGFGQLAFWVPALQEYLVLGLAVPGENFETDVFSGKRFLGVADRIVNELGWMPDR